MKKFFRSIALSTIALVFIVGNAMAYQITLDVSAERTQSRNATQGTVKAAYYNQAGLVNLTEGFYVDLGNRILNLKTQCELGATNPLQSGSWFDGEKTNSNTWTLLLPNAAAVWRVGPGALFLTFDIREGGAGGSWNSAGSINIVGTVLTTALGTPTFNLGGSQVVQSIDMETYTYGITFGGSARLNDMVAFTGGVRYLQKNSTVAITGLATQVDSLPNEVEYVYYGWQGIFGVMITPMQGLNIALNFTSWSEKLGERCISYRSVNPDIWGSDNSISPAMIALGIGYKVADNVEVQLSYNVTLEGEWQLGARSNSVFDRQNHPTHVVGLGTEYKLMDLITASFGISFHTHDVSNANNNNVTDPSMSKIVFGAGVVITPMEKLSIDLGIAYHMYLDAPYRADYLGMGNRDLMTHSRYAIVLGIGVSYGI